MKQTLLALSVLIYCSSQLFAMEQELLPVYKATQKTITNPESLNAIIIGMDGVINQKCNTKPITQANAFLNFISPPQLTEHDFFAIIATIQKNFPSIQLTKELVKALYKKNSHFASAIDFFSAAAHNNIDNVTCNTVDTVYDHIAQQPTALLNRLPVSIKKYVMEKEFQKITNEYTIFLTGHTKNITALSVCAATDHAATASLDATLRLWDLKTATQIRTFDITDIVHLINFLQDGSQIASCSGQDKSIIKIWNPHTGDLLLTIQHRPKIYAIKYANVDKKTIVQLATFHFCNTDTDTISLLTFNTSDMTTPTCYSTLPILPSKANSTTWNKSVSTSRPYEASTDAATLFVTKESCRELFLCEQAIKNTENSTSLFNIEQSAPYRKLTDYEKSMIQKQRQQKITALQAVHQQLHNKRITTTQSIDGYFLGHHF